MSKNNCEWVILCAQAWDIEIKNVIEVTESSARCFILDDGRKKYFFKMYQEKFNFQMVDNEIAVCSYLKEKGLFVSEFIRSNRGTYIEYIDGTLCTLQKYITGITCCKFEVAKPLLLDSARTLANINHVLEECPVVLPVKFDQQWIEQYSKAEEIENYEKLLAQLDQNDNYYMKIANDFQKKCEMIRIFDSTLFSASKLTFENSHGDYHVLQLIFSKEKIKSVIDFSSCARLPLCWEIIRSYSLSSIECRNSEIDMDNFIDYVKAYLKIKGLKKEDLELMPFFYLFSLLRSSFGYKGYIKKKMNGNLVDEKDKNALEFAFWRTNMAKWLFENSERLSSQLGKCL